MFLSFVFLQRDQSTTRRLVRSSPDDQFVWISLIQAPVIYDILQNIQRLIRPDGKQRKMQIYFAVCFLESFLVRNDFL